MNRQGRRRESFPQNEQDLTRERRELDEQRLEESRIQTRLWQAYRAKLAAAISALRPEDIGAREIPGALKAVGDRLAYQYAEATSQLWRLETYGPLEVLERREYLLGRLLHLGATDYRVFTWLLERRHWQDFAPRKHDSISPAELSEFAAQTAELILTEVPAEHHDRLRAKMAALIGEKTEDRRM